VADCCVEKCVCPYEQTTFWCADFLTVALWIYADDYIDPEYAAAFFVLGGSLKDAVSVCIKHLQDFQLAIALARIMEGRDDGPVLKEILMNTVLPIAFQDGNRFLASWCFWTLHRRDLSLRILVVSLLYFSHPYG